MSNFKKYDRKGFVEARPVTNRELLNPEKHLTNVSISEADKKNGSPHKGDMVARDPDNHDDMWLINKEFFNKNYETNE